MNLLKLIRWKNLILIAGLQLLIKYALFPAFAISTTLNTIQFAILIIASLCIAAGGFVINAIYNMEPDAVNKPNKRIVGIYTKEETANYLYILFTFIGVCLGFYLSQAIYKPSFFGVFVIISALLYIHASYLKQILIVGNLVASIIVASSIMVIGMFELLPAITKDNQQVQTTMFEILADFGIFVIFIQFIREIVKDIQNVTGDYKYNRQTLPIVFGVKRSAKIAFGITCITILIVVYYIASFLYMHTIAIVYFLVAVIGPLIYVAIKLFAADKNAHFKPIDSMLKIVMITGLLAMLVYKLIF